jgi:N-acetylmuramoyl-L-alanine amidase
MSKISSYSKYFNLTLTTKFILIYLTVSCFIIPEAFSQEKFKIVIDAGHGGKDPGRPNPNGIIEKNIVLNIALNLGRELKDDGNEIIYTRDKDVFLTLRQRAKIANEADADLFISIHCNSFHDSRVYGSETFVYGLHVNKANFDVALKENEVIFLEENFEKNYQGFDPKAPESLIGLTLMQEEYLDQSILLASFVQDNFAKKLNRKNRGVKQSGFWVLHNTYMPSVLIEAGFITNPKEGAYLNSSKAQKDISHNIFNAVKRYKTALGIGENYEVEYRPKENIVYKVQIAASKRKLELKSYNFKGLKDLSVIKEGRLYRYFYGNSYDYNKILENKKKAVSKGYRKSFVVTFKNGKIVAGD